MNRTESLDAIWQSYQTNLDCHRVAIRGISKGNLVALEKTGFLNTPIDEAKQKIQISRAAADDHVILSLWAVFERSLLSRLQSENKRILAEPQTKITHGVYQKIDDELEYWRIEDVLDIFKIAIDPTLIGGAKQIKKYRDWVAHKNPRKSRPQNVPPENAYKLLREISSQLDKIGTL